MAAPSSSFSSSLARFRENFNESIEDPVSTELMTRAVTVVPCGHTFNEDTVIQCLARDRLCPLDRIKIERYVPNYSMRHLVESAGALPTKEEGPSSEAEAHFLKGKTHADQGNNEQAIEAFLQALQLCPCYEKAQAYLDFCLRITSQSPSPGKAPSPSLSKGKKSVESRAPAKEGYIKLLLQLLEEPVVQQIPELTRLFENQVESLMDKETLKLSSKEKESYKWTQQLIVDKKISSFVTKKLQQLFSSSSPLTISLAQSSISSYVVPPSMGHSSYLAAPYQQLSFPSSSNTNLSQSTPYITVGSPITTSISRTAGIEAQPRFPEIVFGKAKWAKYFGDIGVEPPLPANIEEILEAPCIFWPGKKVRKTHLLVLIPEKVNEKPLHLDSLAELIKSPKIGYKTQYRGYSNYVKKELGTKSFPSHWILMTKDVIPNSRNKSYEDQKAFVVSHASKSGTPYEFPTALEAAVAILMHYVATGEALYTDNQLGKEWSYTRCQEKVENNQWPAAIGGFTANGLAVSCDWGGVHYGDCGVGCVRRV